MEKSETSGVRGLLSRYCIGDGLDVGFGGDPIVPTAICLDMLKPYTNLGDAPQHLHGTASNLPFKDGTLDYVYSSHIIEDFTYEAQCVLVHEWARVIRKGGILILCAPDEQRYRLQCEETGQPVNLAHVNSDYSILKFKERVLGRLETFQLDILMERNGVGNHGYSWCMVLGKK